MERTVSIITTCMGRLKHAKQTIPLMAKAGADEIVFVDYNCGEKSSDWVRANFPNIKVVREHDATSFNASRAKNLGARVSSGDILFFVDIDICVHPQIVCWIRKACQHNTVIRVGGPLSKANLEAIGTFAVSKDLFLMAGRFDETFELWGGEDTDLYFRLRQAGSLEVPFPSRSLTVLHHDDDLRVANRAGVFSKKSEQHLVSRTYQTIKNDILRLRDGIGDLEEAIRKDLWQQSQRSVRRYLDEGKAPEIRIAFDQVAWLPMQRQLRKKISITYCLDQIEPQPD